MRKFAACALGFAVLAVCSVAVAGPYNPPRQWDDLSWWGTSGATPAPVKDARVNAYWWWPTQPVSNANDQELWGNRGKVLHNMIIVRDDIVEPPLPPVPPQVDIQIPVVSNVLFDYNKAFIRPEGQQEIDKVVQFMRAQPTATVTVKGYASAEGTPDYNMALSRRRAEAVRDYMVQSGIEPGRITVEAYGEAQPVPGVDQANEAGRKLNRRVEFDIRLPQ